MKKRNTRPFRSRAGQRFALKPDEKKFLPVKDVREQWQKDSEKYPSTKEQRQAFYQQRIKLVEGSEVASEHKEELLRDLRQSVQREESSGEDEAPPTAMPKPGGVGYGAYYKENLLKFKNSSVLHYNIVTIPDIGNANNEWLYLTSTNRSPKGVEAYVCYHLQNDTMFNIFDWSKTDKAQFALSRPYDSLSDYVVHNAAGYETIYVLNATRRKVSKGKQWINEVMLHNPNTNNFDWVYSSDYALTSLEELHYKWWGPIVETFPPFPFAIKDIGFFDARLIQDGLPEQLLNEDVTELRTDNIDFKVTHEAKYYSFIVEWPNP